MTKCIFRKVKFPLLIETDNRVAAVRSGVQLDKTTNLDQFTTKKFYKAIDSTGKRWDYYPEMDALSPLTFDKRWSKVKIIQFYNEHRINNNCIEFVGKSLSSKRLEQVIKEIVEFDLRQ